MPIETRYTDNGTGMIIITRGTVSGREMVEHNHQYAEQYQKCKYWIWDDTEAERYIVSKDEVEIMAEQDFTFSEKNPHVVCAMVAPDDLIYGLDRMYDVLADVTGWEKIIVKTREEACGWIREKLGEDLTFT